MSQVYFEYDTTITIKEIDELNVPGITLCTSNAFSFLDKNILKHQQDEINKISNLPKNEYLEKVKQINKTYASNSEIMKLPINEINKLQRNVSETLSGCTVSLYDNNNYFIKDIPCSNFRNETTMNYSHKCFALFYQSVTEREKVNEEIKRNKNVPQLKIFFKVHTLMSLFIHSPQTIPIGGEAYFCGAYNGHYTTFIYSKHTTKLLPPPYKTNCRNYYEDGYESQKDCYESCVTNITIEKCNAWPELINAPINVTYRFVGKIHSPGIYPKCMNDVPVYDICKKKCLQPDCISEQYLFRQQWKQESKDAWILITVPYKSTEYIHAPKLQLVEYLCYLGSIVSMWFGLSILSLFSKGEQVVNIIKSKQFHISLNTNSK